MIMRFPGGLRKALTLSYDDGVEQDIELIRILDESGIRATFNINSGLFAKAGTVYPAGQIHRRMTLDRAKALYQGTAHEVAVHALPHPDLTGLPAAQVPREVLLDREDLEREFGGIIRSFAKKMGGHKDVWYATNIEIVDYVNAYRSLIVSADGSTVHNPTAATLWLEGNGALHRIAPVETRIV